MPGLLLQLTATAVLYGILYYIAWRQFIRPLWQMQFYWKQNINCEFVPLTGSNPADSRNVIEHGDYYHSWLNKSRGNPRPKLFCKNIGSTVALILTDPQLVRDMFICKDDFIKHPFQNALVKRLSPYGLVLLQGSMWKKHRKLISKGFEYERIDSLLGGVHNISRSLVERIASDTQLIIDNVFNFFKTIAGNIISLTYFQQDVASLLIDGKSMPIFLSDLIASLTNQSYNWKYCIFGMPLVDLKLFSIHRELLRNIDKMRSTVRNILLKQIDLRRSCAKPTFSMWDIFIDETNPEQAFSHDEIIDEFITFFSDGVYTTGHFMTMMTYNLVKNPEWKNKLRQQLKENLSHINQPTQALINSLPILTACTKETLRLAPPVVTGIERICVNDTVLYDGTKVSKDTLVMACHLVNHLDPQMHDDPTVFNPDRWLTPSRTVDSVRDYPGSYIPFSIGQRQCPGQKFAMAEAAIFFSQFLLQYDYEIVNEETYKLRFQQQFLREPLEPFSYSLTKLN